VAGFRLDVAISNTGSVVVKIKLTYCPCPGGEHYMRRILAIFGAALFVSALALFGYLAYIFHLDMVSRQIDRISEKFSSYQCSAALKSAVPPTRTPVIGESILVSLMFINPGREDCEVTVTINAAGFDKDPEDPLSYILHPGSTPKYFTISAKAAGQHEVVVSCGNVDITFGMRVLSNQFLSPSATLVASGFLSILGPMATIPWWIDLYRRRKEKPVEKTTLADPPAA
jgi:hypothetical protein